MDFIKNIDRRYLIMGGSVIGLVLVLLLSVVLLSSCSSKISYEKLESKMVSAASRYIEEKGKPELNQKMVITTDTLVEGKYLKQLSKYNDDTCEGTVTVYNNGGILNYLPYLSCTNYKTVLLKDKIIDDNLVSEKSGLYAVNGEYVFRGDKVYNYVKFSGVMFRILGIDAEGNLRLVAVNESEDSVQWDNKFNENTNDITGETVYEESAIYNHLNNKYSRFEDKYKKKIVVHSLCIGARDKNDLTVSRTLDCNQILENQTVGLINASDYALASLDKDCSDIKNNNCMNYNYLYSTIKNTWTANVILGSTSEVVAYYSGTFRRNDASDYLPYNLVIYISGNEVYKKGNGTYNDPYIVE